MKNIYTFFFSLFVTLIANAQPVLHTINTNAIGDTVNRIGIDTIKDAATTGASGANVTWNFTNVDSINFGRTFYVAPSTTPYASTGFAKKANIASYAVGANYNSYQFYNSQPGYFVNVGAAGGPVDSMVFPTRYDTVVYYPFTYQSAVNDSSIAYTHVLGTYTDKVYSGRHSYVDGYGTLKLPNATYNNVIRYRNEFFIVDSLFNGTNYAGQKHTNYIKEYFWTSQDYRGILLYMEKAHVKDGVPQKQGPFWYSKTPYPVGNTTSVNDLALKNIIDIFPNPSSGIFSLNVKTGMIGATLKITSIAGENVLTTKITSEIVNIDLGKYPSGIYLYSICSSGTAIATGKIQLVK